MAFLAKQSILLRAIIRVAGLQAALGALLVAGGNGLVHGADVPTKLLPINDAKIVLAPYAWKCSGEDSAARAEATMPGAYGKAAFRGSATLGLVIDGTANHGCPESSMPVVEYSVDEGPFQVVPLTKSGEVYTLPLADHLDAALPHRVEFYFRAADLGQKRWTDSTAHLRLVGLSVEEGGELLSCPMRARKAIAFGDSITEGVGVDGPFTSWQKLAPNNARCTWVHFVCGALDCEYGQFGSGGQGMVNPTLNVPPLPKTWDHYDATASRLTEGRLLPEPDYVLCNMGNNDGASSLTNDYVAWVKAVRAACPNARIFCIVPPAGVHREEVQATVKACNQAGDARVHRIEIPLMKIMAPNTGKPTQGSYDGGHPTLYGEAVFGACVAVEIQKVLDQDDRRK